MKNRQREVGSGVLATECAAFLNGTLAEYWDEKGFIVPVWAWTNLLAHGSAGLIAESVTGPQRPRKMARSWRIARSYLAYEVLDVIREDLPLSELQSSILIPLELEMASRPEVSRWSPRLWVDTVDHAIRAQHSNIEP